VLFLHGLVMDNLSSWYFTVATKAAAHRQVMLYDMRGHGRSSRPERGYDLGSLCEEALAVIDSFAPEQAVQIVGNSFGGLLAIVLALEHPSRVHSLALVDALLPEPGFATQMEATLSLQGEAADARIQSSFQSWLGRHSQRKRSRLAESARALVYETTLLQDLRRSTTYEDSDYARIQVPVLALYGESSDQRQAGERLCEQLEVQQLELIEGATHSVLWEATDQVQSRLLEWLASQG